MTSDKNTESAPARLLLEIEEGQESALFWFLQSGFYCTGVEVGCSVKSFLVSHLGMTPEYIRHSISTIFLDGMPVDNLVTAVVRDGSRLALSSALPGLVGATMRSGGALASLRSSITYKDSGICKGGTGTINIKLFNMVMEEAGPLLLEKGILVARQDLETFLKKNPEFIGACRKVLLDDEIADLPELTTRIDHLDTSFVMLSIATAPSTA